MRDRSGIATGRATRRSPRGLRRDRCAIDLGSRRRVDRRTASGPLRRDRCAIDLGSRLRLRVRRGCRLRWSRSMRDRSGIATRKSAFAPTAFTAAATQKATARHLSVAGSGPAQRRRRWPHEEDAFSNVETNLSAGSHRSSVSRARSASWLARRRQREREHASCDNDSDGDADSFARRHRPRRGARR